ncbi:carbohydrate kinase [Rhodococcus sp. ACPA4]|uniref:Gluconokinase n=2 Tax=Nocardiaceae TaxID=85025 RepID=A0A652YQS1_NOCGL|nr:MULTISPECIES: gluconokinase [Rhodococcus]NMD63544.1 gluconokinase [Nocardia globerula]MDV6268708.1 gluconokinase [Rhodococcus globerulus]NRI69241.1 gluconokinase [Rhodococcus sp. MS16]PBC43217.1 carbohydrate kinase [Rhodococcus sp. ACPA4]PVX63109.1 gluconokinase [Rhodococcus globerulus]
MTEKAAQKNPVLVVMGVSGSGKSTVGGMIAGAMGWDLQEGDDLHPQANIEKMATGHPLNDDDRWPWLDKIAQWITQHTDAGQPGIVTCSALKRSYRDILRGENVVFVHLAGSRDQIGQRLTARLDHYMPPSLLDSQISTLEPIDPDEQAIIIDVGGSPVEIVEEILRRLEELGY